MKSLHSVVNNLYNWVKSSATLISDSLAGPAKDSNHVSVFLAWNAENWIGTFQSELCADFDVLSSRKSSWKMICPGSSDDLGTYDILFIHDSIPCQLEWSGTEATNTLTITRKDKVADNLVLTVTHLNVEDDDTVGLVIEGVDVTEIKKWHHLTGKGVLHANSQIYSGTGAPDAPNKDLEAQVRIFFGEYTCHKSRRSKWANVVQILFGVTGDGGGVAITPSGKPIPIDPWGPLSLSTAKQDIIIGLALTEVSSLANDANSRKAINATALELISNALNQLRREI